MATDDDPDEETAREFATEFGERAFAAAVERLTEDGRERVVAGFPEEFRDGRLDAAEALERYWRGLYSRYGAFEGVDDATAGDDGVTVEFAFADGTEPATIRVEDGGVTDLSFAPEYEAPDYVDQDTFTEREATVDAGDVALDGVLAVPDGEGPFPGVVLVHGHGVHDPDGTVGATKILRDLAWGLASEGIATLRYEKRLREHEVADEEYTLDTVVTDDAVAAVAELAAADEVDPGRTFVAGHSQGGMCAPRIADRCEDLASVVLLDPPADPVVDPDDLAWLRYAMEPDGDLDEQQEAELEAKRETFRRIADGEFDDEETIMGKPGAWHRSHREYDPLATAVDLEAPVFVVTAGGADRETQRELHEFHRGRFEAWRDADLPDGSRTEFYGGLDHYLRDVRAPSPSVSLYFGGNASEDVLEDAADWIRDVA